MNHVRALTALLTTFHLGKQPSAINQVDSHLLFRLLFSRFLPEYVLIFQFFCFLLFLYRASNGLHVNLTHDFPCFRKHLLHMPTEPHLRGLWWAELRTLRGSFTRIERCSRELMAGQSKKCFRKNGNMILMNMPPPQCHKTPSLIWPLLTWCLGRCVLSDITDFFFSQIWNLHLVKQ